MRFYGSLFLTSVKSSISARKRIVFETILLIVNNLMFLALWWIFFSQFEEIGGWHFHDMAILMAIGMGSYGLMQVCFGKARELALAITRGDLDALMTQPKSLLLHLIGSQSLTRGWGHLSTSLLLIVLGDMVTMQILPLVLLGIFCGCLVMASFTVAVQSLAFWMGPIDSLSRKYCDALLLFSFYPTKMFPSFLQVVLFTVIPAGIIGNLPLEMMHGFTWSKLFVLLTGTFSLVGLSFIVFYSGLKRYESGNQIC